MDPVALGARFRAIAREPRYFEAMGDFGYLDGGCRIYAEALLAALGPEASAVYVVGITRNDEGTAVVHHVAVAYDGHCFDADGAVPAEAYLARYARLEPDLPERFALRLCSAAEVAQDPVYAAGARSLPMNRHLSAELAAAFRASIVR